MRYHVLFTMPLALMLTACVVQAVSAGADEDQPSNHPSSEEHVSPEAFLASPFAEFFKADDYTRALYALEPILERYPHDPLVLRYKAMTLDRLGRSGEAVAIYRDLLRQFPDHAPTHLFLGEAYERMGRSEEAIGEWRWVAAHSSVPEYRRWAQEGIALSGLARPALPEQKRWTVASHLGWDWDSNVTLKPSGKAFAAPGDQNASRFSVDLGLRYRALARRNAEVSLSYTSRQSFHTDGLDEFNFTSEEFGLDARTRMGLLGREVTMGARYDLLGGFLDEELFSFSNRFTLSTDAQFSPHTRTILFNRLTVSNFGPDGSTPELTSRDGVSSDLGFTQYWYTNDLQRYLFLREEYHIVGARGNNFDRRGSTTRIGLFSPLLWRTDAEVSTGFDVNAYAHFSSLSSLDRAQREDRNWDMAASLTHRLSDRLALRLQYQWFNADNRNEVFQYHRQIVGLHLLFSQSF